MKHCVEKKLFFVKVTFVFIAISPYLNKIIIFCKSSVFTLHTTYRTKNNIFCITALMSKKRYFFVKVMYSAPPPYEEKNNIFCKRDPILHPLIRSKRYFFVKVHYFLFPCPPLISKKRYFFVKEMYLHLLNQNNIFL